jgi:hypothetical protein
MRIVHVEQSEVFDLIKLFHVFVSVFVCSIYAIQLQYSTRYRDVNQKVLDVYYFKQLSCLQ